MYELMSCTFANTYVMHAGDALMTCMYDMYVYYVCHARMGCMDDMHV